MYLTLSIIIAILVLVIVGQHCYHVSEMARMKSVATDAWAAADEARTALWECKSGRRLRLVNRNEKGWHIQ